MTSHPAADPFALLGLAPTMRLDEIKRAYFAALSRTPPHADPEGFRRLRAAYESLIDEKARRLACLLAPVDFEAELHRFEQQWGERIAAAREAASREQAASAAIERFIERISRASLDDLRG